MHEKDMIVDMMEKQRKMDVPPVHMDGTPDMKMRRESPVILYLERQLELRHELINTPDLNKRLEVFDRLMR